MKKSYFISHETETVIDAVEYNRYAVFHFPTFSVGEESSVYFEFYRNGVVDKFHEISCGKSETRIEVVDHYFEIPANTSIVISWKAEGTGNNYAIPSALVINTDKI